MIRFASLAEARREIAIARKAAGPLRIRAFCPTGPGGGIDPTCSPGGSAGGGGELRSLSSFVGELPLNKYGKPSGVKPLGAVDVKVYRVGPQDRFKERGGVFFGGEPSDVAPYASMHEGHEIKEYEFSLKNAVLAGHQNDLTKAWFGKTYGEMQDGFLRRLGAHVANAAFDKKLFGEAKKRGFDAIVYVSPAPPAKTELGIVGDPSKKLRSRD